MERSWLDGNRVDPGAVVLNRFNGVQWVPLPTERLQDQNGLVIYEGQTPGFSIFALAGETEPARVSLFAVTAAAPEAPPPPATPASTPPPSLPIASVLGLAGLVGAVAVAILLGTLARKRKRT